MLSSLKRAFSGCILAATLFLGVPVTALAAVPYSSLRLTTTGGGTITMAPGEVKNIAVSFQNTGSQTWKNDGAGYISLYTYGPKYRKSAFDPGTWLSASQVKRLGEASVKPGATGTILFSLRAPSTVGSYKETFALAAENAAWVTGGEFTLNISVKVPETVVKPTPATAPTSTTVPASGYSASVVTQTATKLKVLAKKTISFSAVIKNTGTKTWKTVGLSSSAMNIASGTSDFRNATWSGSQVALLTQAVRPGETAPVQFFFTAPSTNGLHTAKFQIMADDVNVPDAFVIIPVEVTGGSAEVLNAPVVENLPPALEQIPEPSVRVGVLIVDEETEHEIHVTSYESDFELRDVENIVIGEYPKGKVIEAAFDDVNYLYNDGSGTKKHPKALRFIPKTPNAVMTITNFDRRETRDTQFANNTFRNVLEMRYNSIKGRTWVINELPVELYLRGMAETSDLSPMEYQKAILTAARTYAFYHITHTSKHKAEGFQIDAYRDQVYWGYGQEERTPRITQAVNETRGHIVTYNKETAITSYFSRSDGRTRNWSDVWAGDVPYARSVPVPCDVGRTLWGHGVGMSATGAICMAKEGKTWKEILTYFYTGVEVNKKWD